MEELYIDLKESEVYFLNGTGNFTFNSSLVIDQYALPFTVSLVVITLYAITFVVGLLGNIGIYYILNVCGKEKTRTISNIFISSIVFNDMFLIVFCIPLTNLHILLFDSWPFGSTACPLLKYIQWSLFLQKSLSLVVVSCDRCYVITRPLKKRISKRNAQFVILATYVLAACVALPIAFRTKFVEVLYEGQFVGICTEIWSSSESKTIYTISLLLLHFIIPLTIMTVSNIRIVHILWTKKIPGEPDEKRDRRVAGSKRKSVKILVSMVITFAVAWLPIEVLTLIGVTDYSLLDNEVSYLLWTFSQWWTFINCVSSPLLYFCFIKRYRKTFKEIFAKARCLRLLEHVCCVRKSSVNSKEGDIFCLKR